MYLDKNKLKNMQSYHIQGRNLYILLRLHLEIMLKKKDEWFKEDYIFRAIFFRKYDARTYYAQVFKKETYIFLHRLNPRTILH